MAFAYAIWRNPLASEKRVYNSSSFKAEEGTANEEIQLCIVGR